MPIDVGESAGGKYIFDSKVKGKKKWRGRTRAIENLVTELEAAEAEIPHRELPKD